VRPTRAIGVGVFVLGGLLLFAVALFMVGDRRGIFSDSFVVYSEFRSLSGLQPGTTVRVAGMNAGEVKDIGIPSGPSGRFRVKLEIRRALHPLIRTDSTVSIRTEGLVGVQYLQVSAGSEGAPRLPENGVLQGREAFDMSDVLEQMSSTVRIVNETILELKGDVEEAISAVQQAAADADTLLTRVTDDVVAITSAGGRIANDAAELSARVRAGEGSVGRLFADDQLYKEATSLTAEARATVENLRRLSERAAKVIEAAGAQSGTVGVLAGNLQTTLLSTQTAMTNLAETTEAMKHNFLLRGFFKRRGYFSLSELSPIDYRQGVLEQEGRKALRIWVPASLLFEPTGPGPAALTDRGRERLDSAMGTFLKYREAGPLIVEGHAQGPDESARYLVSRTRAAVVRDYLVARFELDPTATGIIALGGEPVGVAPAPGWEGVVLAVFIDPRQAARQ
jgi:phospholipid/cholesterol/gamma-HCH transport system substrate-binding protein